MKKPRRLIFLIFCLASSLIYGQATILSLSKKIGDYKYSFPFIKTADRGIADKINMFLQKKILGNKKIETSIDKIFEKTRYKKSEGGGLIDVSFIIEKNSPAILSLAIYTAFTSATTYEGTDFYNFNLLTGEEIKSSDLFKPEGIKQIRKILITARRKLINEHMKEIIGREEYEVGSDSSLIREQFIECNKTADETQFCIQKGTILFYKGFCLSHAEQVLDYGLDVEMTYQKIRPYLSTHGKELLQIK